MQLKFFHIPAYAGEEYAEALNQFLGTHRIVTIGRHFVADGASSFWAACVTYLPSSIGAPAPKKGKIDYRDLLPEAEFAVFAKLRLLRKQLAEQDGVPAYALFTNEQLAAMVQRRAITHAGLREIPGVGDARLEKYASQFLAILKKELVALSETGEGPADEA